jgi:two-component system sensor histidine kinase MprB
VASVGSVALPVDAEDQVLARSGGGQRTRTVQVDSTTYRVQTVALPAGGAVQIARDYGESQRVLDGLRWWLLLVAAATAALGAGAGWLIARRATEPLVQLTDAAEEVATTGRLDVPIPVSGNDEPGRLGRAFATMLGALGRSREQQQQLVQDAGHELRTPLTSLRTNVETLQRYESLPEETRRSILSDLEAETRELGALVDELVQLATDTYNFAVAADQLPTETVNSQLVLRPPSLHAATHHLRSADSADFKRIPTRLHPIDQTPGEQVTRRFTGHHGNAQGWRSAFNGSRN